MSGSVDRAVVIIKDLKAKAERGPLEVGEVSRLFAFLCDALLLMFEMPKPRALRNHIELYAPRADDEDRVDFVTAFPAPEKWPSIIQYKNRLFIYDDSNNCFIETKPWRPGVDR